MLARRAFRPLDALPAIPVDGPRPPPEPRSARYPAPRTARRAVWTQGR